jgi:hypothetical protein
MPVYNNKYLQISKINSKRIYCYNYDHINYNVNEYPYYDSKPTIIGLASSTKNYVHKYINTNQFEKTLTKIPTEYKKNTISPYFVKEYYCGKKKNKLNSLQRMKYDKYYTHDNGGHPFLVYIKNKNIYIYKVPEETEVREIDYGSFTDEQWQYMKLVKEYKNVKKIFIGKTILNKMTKFSGGHGKKYDGNTILVQLSNKKYVYIGENIFSFISYYPIKKYYSPIGNSDVPYPFAIDNNNRYYLISGLGENIVIRNIPAKYKRDPYDYYHSFNLQFKRSIDQTKIHKKFRFTNLKINIIEKRVF